MTITFLMPDGVEISATRERQAKAPMNGGGANRPLGGRSGFRVDTASNILTASSTTWTLKPCSAQIDPGFTTHQGMYGWACDADETGSVTAADATYTRKDIVYIQVNDSSAGDGSGALTAPVAYLAGTPSATPTAPTLPARSFLVGTITVPQTGGGSPTVVLNPARFVAAGAPLPVESQTVQDALTKYPASKIIRTDDKYKEYVSDGTKWMPPAGAQGMQARHIFSTTDSGVQIAIVVLQSIASFTFLGGRRYRIGFEANYYTDNIGVVVLFRVATCATTDAANSTTGLTVRNQTDAQATRTTTGFPVRVYGYYEPTVDTTLQVKATGQRVVGSDPNGFFMQRAPETPNILFIEDLGAQF
jgi:hypothetical protein